jgi:molybdenum cofactor biosynthesis enzyme
MVDISGKAVTAREAVAEAKEGGDVDALDDLHRRLKKEIRGDYANLQDLSHLISQVCGL